jgi:hypothetical protein
MNGMAEFYEKISALLFIVEMKNVPIKMSQYFALQTQHIVKIYW